MTRRPTLPALLAGVLIGLSLAPSGAQARPAPITHGQAVHQVDRAKASSVPHRPGKVYVPPARQGARTAPQAASTVTRTAAPTRFLACVVRGTASGWAVLDDAGHAPWGVASVEVLSDRVRIHYTQPQAQLAVVQATADETYVRQGIAVGVSAALDHADLFFARGTTPLAPSSVLYSGSNVWLSGDGWAP